MFHELALQDREDGRVTRQSCGTAGTRGVLELHFAGLRSEVTREDAHIRGHRRPFIKYAGWSHAQVHLKLATREP